MLSKCLQTPCSNCTVHSLGMTGLTHSFLSVTVEGACCKLVCLEYVCRVIIRCFLSGSSAAEYGRALSNC